MGTAARRLAVVTGASSGIGLEIAKQAVAAGFDLVVCSEDDGIESAAEALRVPGANVATVQADLATKGGVDKLYEAIGGGNVEVLAANAGVGLGHGFLEQDEMEWRRVVDTNVTGTLYLIQKVARDMVARRGGRILITGSIAGFMPGTFQAVYNGSKAFLDSFSFALRNELKDSGVSVTCLMPGPTETEFFARAGLLDTKVGADEKQPADEVAKAGWDAMMNGEGEVVAGWKNKLQAALAHVTPAGVLAEQHRKMAEPGSASK
ncbi:MAG TPA: SDR family NAD(P)-dependent oxidoreductase [Polyangiaceae bacterium]